jgi:fatty acid desaturase
VAARLIPAPADRPAVLPTERLTATGLAVPELRADLRRIDDGKNALGVAGLWAATVGVVALATWWDTPWGYALAFLAMGPIYVRFAILMHEAAHRLLFTNKAVNDWVGAWLIAYPALIPIRLYRRGHMAHHRREFGPDDPDLSFYGGYPCTGRRLARRLGRDAVGVSGWRNLWPLLKSVTRPVYRRETLSILGVQAVLFAVATVATGRWWTYPLLWFAPWMTEWRVINRLRSIAEHGGMAADEDRRATTHVVRQSLLARFWLVPYNTGWHLAHHVDMGVPWRHLPRFHAELERAGYVTEALTFPSYPALWRALASADQPVAA